MPGARRGSRRPSESAASDGQRSRRAAESGRARLALHALVRRDPLVALTSSAVLSCFVAAFELVTLTSRRSAACERPTQHLPPKSVSPRSMLARTPTSRFQSVVRSMLDPGGTLAERCLRSRGSVHATLKNSPPIRRELQRRRALDKRLPGFVRGGAPLLVSFRLDDLSHRHPISDLERRLPNPP